MSSADQALKLPSLDGGSYTVTLLTGDVVNLTEVADGRYSVEVEPAGRSGAALTGMDIRKRQGGEGLYVTPSDAAPLIASGVLDEELFNVEYLAANGYADNADGQLPVIVEYADRQRAATAAREADSLAATTRTSTLESINAAGVAVEKTNAADFWASLVDNQGDAGLSARSVALPGGIERIWLDRKVQVDLDESVAQVGAPEAWDAGYDGTGSTVCVIDTGIDLSHPDVGAADEFTYEIADENGDTDTATVRVTVAPEMDDPDLSGVVAVDEIAVTRRDTPVVIPVLDNDIGDDLQILQLDGEFLVTDPASGTVKVNDDSTVTYTPDDGFTGDDSFTYVMSDRPFDEIDVFDPDTYDIGMVSVIVGAAEGPIAVDDVVTTQPETPVTITVLDNDLGDGIEVTEAADPANGATTVNDDSTVTYTPADGYAGQVVAAHSFVPGQAVDDGHGHGTHVASTVAGTGAASDGQYAGVAPGAGLVIAKALTNGGSGALSWIIEAMEWCAIDQGVDVVSMSLGVRGSYTDGTDPGSRAVDKLTDASGALFVIAAGNDGPGQGTITTPGAATSALTVGAVDKSDQLASLSSRGPRFLDYAIKPEITAPGVSITAAVPGGGYGTISGTSMATPHVAGAAAILAQQHPDWDADQLKAALVATAENVGYTVYEQGGGRLDIARAVRQQVKVSPATADFGLIPDDQAAPPEPKTLTYTNPTAQPVKLDLAAAVSTTDGDSLPDGVLALDADTLTIPAAGTARVTVSLDQSGLERGTYTGSIVATGPGDTRLTTPLGFAIDKPKHKLTVRLKYSDDQVGILSPNSSNTLHVAGIDGSDEFHWNPFWRDDTFEVWVVEGTYSIDAAVYWLDVATDRVQHGILIEPEVTITGDTEVVLDATNVAPLIIDTPHLNELYDAAITYMRWIPEPTDGLGWRWWTSHYDQLYGHDFWVTPTEQVAKGQLRLSSQLVMGAPRISMEVTGQESRELTVRAQAQHNTRTPPVPRFRGRQSLTLVDAGSGTPEEFQSLDVEGKLVLVNSGAAENPGGPCGTSPEVAQRAEATGAAGVVVVAGPAPATLQSCLTGGYNKVILGNEGYALAVPTVSITFADAEALRDLLARSDVKIQVEGIHPTPYLYLLNPVEKGRIPDSLNYTFTKDQLAQVDHQFHATNTPEEHWMRVAAWKADELLISSRLLQLDFSPFVAPPYQVAEFVGPVGSDTIFRHKVGSAAEPGNPQGLASYVFQTRENIFDTATHTTIRWNDSPTTPGAMLHGIGVSHLVCAGCRQGNALYPQITYSASSDPHQRGGVDRFSDFGDPELHLYRNGQEVPQTPDPWFGVYATYEVPPNQADYRLTHRVGGTDTAWEFTSRSVTDDATPEPYKCTGTLLEELAGESSNTPCRPEPLIFLRYDLGLDLHNQAKAPSLHAFEVTAYRQPSLAQMPAIEGLEVSVSYDGGEEWTEARVRDRGDGEFEVRVVHPPEHRRASDTVSIKAEAWDVDGNRVEQTIGDAFGLTEPAPKGSGKHAIGGGNALS